MADTAKTRHEEVQARFLAQQEARLQQRKESKARSDEGRAPEESVGRFWDDVRGTLEAVEDALNRMRIDTEDRKPAPEATQEAILKQLSEAKALQKRLTDATIFLPPYDVRRAQEEIDGLMVKIEQTRTALAPRKKFSFASKRKTASKAAHGPESAVPEPPCSKPPPAGPPSARGAGAAAPPPAAEEVSVPAMEGFSGRSCEELDLASLGSACRQQQGPREVLLKDLTGCTVRMLEALAFVRLEHLRDCRVWCGPVAGPVYVESCHNCTLVLASRQLRIHNTVSTDFYVHVVSGPIIEDCKALRFAPYCLDYPALAHHFRETELEGTTSAWSDVKDFKWLRAQKSPNWEVLPEAERIGTVRLGSEAVGGAEADEEEEEL